MTNEIGKTTLNADQQRDLLPISAYLDAAPYGTLSTIAQVFWMSDGTVELHVRVITRDQALRCADIIQEATP